MATVYDAVDVAAIPADAKIVLAYIDGNYVTYPACQARFPKAQILTVTTTGTNHALICDVEAGDATPAVAAAGVRKGLYHTIYSAVASYGALRGALAGLEWSWFAADWTGVEHLVPGSIATQYAAPGHGSPGNYDISVTSGLWPSGLPAPPLVPTKEQIMNAVVVNGQRYVYAASPQGHMLEFTPNSADPAGWSVIDITASIEAKHGQAYLVQP